MSANWLDSSENIMQVMLVDINNFIHKTFWFFPILVKMTLFFPILKAPAPFPKRGVRALPFVKMIENHGDVLIHIK